ncbi:uncharacterized protein LOC142786762 [Rhipicephalus microplus]|uniref:uncharacterized protein LOC142786762 n=1 Tax=Rhipicephalus microplus TaxID=6941 RepID=UPI003F6C1916
MYQPAQISTLVQFISNTSGSVISYPFLRSSVVCINLLATAICRTRLYTFALKNSSLPPDVLQLFGGLAPSRGHADRICRIFRSEAWRQVRFYSDCLYAASMGNASQNSALRAYRRDLGIASRTADFLWKMIFASLPRRKKQTCQSGQEVVTLGNASIPPGVKSALEKGPKFCEPPKLDQVELLSLVRSTAARASVDNRDRCIQEGVDCLLPTKQTGTSRQPSVIKSLRAADLKLLQADKEGGFVLAPTTVYKEKADAAVTENFQVANVKPSKVKATASKLCEEAGLQKLASSVRAARGVNLSVFFSAKTHKPEVPFRVIVSEQGTWQRLVGRYLQRSLSVLPVEDPCLIRKPQIVCEFLQQECPSEVSFFSVDVKDLYYSLPMDQVCAEVSDCIDRYGNVKFQDSCGISVRNFLEMLTFYLRSTFIKYDDKLYIQKEGVCIGSCLAPILSDILLAKYDRSLINCLQLTSAVKVFRFVDDFLILYRSNHSEAQQRADQIVDVFRTCLGSLQLTTEFPIANKLRFLDIEVFFCPTTCAGSMPPAPKKVCYPTVLRIQNL